MFRKFKCDILNTSLKEIQLKSCPLNINPSMAKVFPGTQTPKLGSLLTLTVFTNLINVERIILLFQTPIFQIFFLIMY